MLAAAYVLIGISCGVAYRDRGLGSTSITAFLADYALSNGGPLWMVDGLQAVRLPQDK